MRKLRDGFLSIDRAGNEIIFQIINVIENATTDLRVFGTAFLASPDFKRIGLDAQECCRFHGIEFLLCHEVTPFLIMDSGRFSPV